MPDPPDQIAQSRSAVESLIREEDDGLPPEPENPPAAMSEIYGG
jgi:hypothetical protein